MSKPSNDVIPFAGGQRFFECLCTITLLLSAVMLAGCSGITMGISWHARNGWTAQEIFDDPLVVALCTAIEENDLIAMQRALDAGVDVNTKGAGNVTPLLWAFPDGKLERLELLLKSGADPNVIVTSDVLDSSAKRYRGLSVTHLACETDDEAVFDAVFDFGGDPNLPSAQLLAKGSTAVFFVIERSPESQKRRRLQKLIDLGANLNHFNDAGTSPAELAVGWFGQYDTCLFLLESGADPSLYARGTNMKLIHSVLGEQRKGAVRTDKQKQAHARLVKWLEDHGESMEQARSDFARWATAVTLEEMKAMREREIRERAVEDANADDARQEAEK